MTTYYKTRFVPQADALGLVALFHLARTALAGKPCSRHDRMMWAAAAYVKEHPEVKHLAAYKDLDGLLT